MSASHPGRMRGPWMTSPLLLLLLLLSFPTRTVFGQFEEYGADAESGTEEDGENADPDLGPEDETPTTETPTMDPDVTSPTDAPDDSSSGFTESTDNPDTVETSSTPEEPSDDGLSTIIILIPVMLVGVIIGIIVCGIFINRRWNAQARNQELRKQDPYLDGPSEEKVPMPMFEEDVPSVLELEMEELDQWMIKDGETAEESEPAKIC